MMMIKRDAEILNPQTGKSQGKIVLIGELVKADRLISESGRLQGFRILSGGDNLRDAWFENEKLLVRSGNIQQLVKIATFATEEENLCYFDLIPGTKEFLEENARSGLTTRTKRGLAIIQTLLGY
jgi:hypothetical protein